MKRVFAVALIVLSSQFAVQATVTNGLVGWWKLDEGSGTLTADASGSGQTGTLTASPTWTSGIHSNAINVTRTSYVNVPYWSGYTLTNAISLSIWIKPTGPGSGPPGYDSFFTKGDGYYGNWGVRFVHTCNLLFQMTGMNGNSMSTIAPISSNRWSHVVASFDGTISKFYINGQLDNMKAWSGSQTSGTSSVVIGKVNGALDDARIYNRALTEQEVLQLFFEQDSDLDGLVDANEVLFGTDSYTQDSDDDGFTDGLEVLAGTDPLDSNSHPDFTTGLAGYWKLDEGVGTTTADTTTNANTGTLANSPTWVTGVRSNALQFDGDNDYVVCGVGGSGSSLAVSNMTISMWVANTNFTQESLVLHRINPSGGYRLSWSGTYGNLGFVIPNVAVNISLSEIQSNLWQYVTYSYDGSKLRAYLNGTLRTTISTTNAVGSSTGALYLGQSTAFTGRYRGKLDDVRVNGQVLDAGTILVLAKWDTDGDGIPDVQETRLGTDPNNADSDGDGMPDGWEVAHGLDSNHYDATSDYDGDGVDNLNEYLQGRDPTTGAIADAGGLVNLTVFTPLE